MNHPPEAVEPPQNPIRGRGALSNREGRYERRVSVALEDDVWWQEDTPPAHPRRRLEPDYARRIISTNRSPDIPFEQSINAYQGCEHGCIYCFARPAHAWLELSPGLDFETRLFFKADAARLLRRELARPGYQVSPIAMGTNTDPYQPVERSQRITRALLEVLLEHRHPVTLVTKSALILRDLDLLEALARQRLVHVSLSVTTLDDELKRRLEPRTASAGARLRTIAALDEAGVPTGVMVAPVIPALNDSELEQILAAARQAGARRAGYILLRLPHEVAPLFTEWLEAHYPERRDHVLSIVSQSRGGRLYRSRWGERMRGTGVFADLLAQRFRKASKRLGFETTAWPALDGSAFRPPHAPVTAGASTPQGSLF
jgi:DNA repair photolyase